MAQELYTFSVSLLQGGPLQVWQTGTLNLAVDSSNNAACTLTIPGYYSDPFILNGTASPNQGQAGTFVFATGGSPQSDDTEIAFMYTFDGFLYDCTYLGGTLYILDNAAQEGYKYVIQGYTCKNAKPKRALQSKK
jgi:hypothetical protein